MIESKLLEVPLSAMQRERLERYGAKVLETHELLAILLRTGSKDLNVLQLAVVVLNTFEDLHSLKMASLDELMQINGIGRTKAIELKAGTWGALKQCCANETREDYVLQDGRPVDCAGVEGCLSGTSCRLVFEHEKRDYQEENDLHRWVEQCSGASQRNFPGGSAVFGGARHHWP